MFGSSRIFVKKKRGFSAVREKNESEKKPAKIAKRKSANKN
jgi:hypothetical protein